jgi:catechol-2,3-dioxygenase
MGSIATPIKVPSPNKLAHVVLRTKDMPGMTKWYCDFLGGRIVHTNPAITFITYDDEHHRMAFINIPDLQDKVRHSSGLEHISFTWDSLADLVTAYKVRKDKQGVEPVWCVNHGLTTSLYYKDPDGNLLGR